MIVGLPQKHHIEEDPQTLRPIGSIIKLMVSTNPATILGFGAWERISKGRILTCVAENDPDFGATEKKGGTKTHTITQDESARHIHNATGNISGHSHDVGNLSVASVGGHTHTIATSGSNSNEATGGDTAVGSKVNGITGQGGAHLHVLTGSTASSLASESGTTSNFPGGSQPHNNLPPYMTVYIWKRTA